MPLGLMISLGGTPEPLVRAIAEHRPRWVCYFASQRSVVQLGTVHNLLGEEGITLDDFGVVLVDDVNDLVHCFAKGLECASFFAKKGLTPDEVVVDYTGGTKTMTAAMALAAVRKGFSFSYVGGTERTKAGLGTVVGGTEVVYTDVSPWQIFAVEEWQQLVLHVNHYHYEAALLAIKETILRQPPHEHMCWQGLSGVIEGLLKWDQFNHRRALPELREGIQKLETWGRIREDERLRAFVDQARECLEFLQQTASETRGFQRIGRPILVDLLSNADRRAAQGRYDDAMARLYRSLEMRGQLAFEQHTGASTSAVSPDSLPVGLRDEFVTRYQDSETGKLQLPLYATFRVLQALDDPAGHEFFAQQGAFTKVLSARNQSVLAHGIQAVSRETFEEFRDLLRSSFEVYEAVTFPLIQSPI
ncbi:MAG: TIGR02710 family CRISPR-associated CARF protein [Desulfomonilaceae bacterium]